MQKSSPRQIMILSCLVFVFLGICSAGLGPILPELAGNAQVNLAMMGAVYSSLFTGSILSQFIMGPIADRFGQKLVLSIGIVIIAAGLLAFNFRLSYVSLLIFSALTGVGMGAVVLGNNVLIAITFPNRSVSALNLINFFYGVGAVSGPAIVSLVISHFGFGRWVVGLDALAFLSLLPFVLRLKIPRATAMPISSTRNETSLIKSRLLWMLAGISLLYVGLEVGLGGWITTYVNRTTQVSLETAALVTSGFWLTYTLGRLLNTWLGMQLTSERILLANLAVAGAGSLLFALSTGQEWATIAAILILGFSFGAVYPTLLAAASTAFRNQPGQAVSIVATLGSGGGVLIPALLGFLIENAGPSSIAWASLVIIATMLGFLLVIRKSLIRSTAIPG
jgi:fucose permease